MKLQVAEAGLAQIAVMLRHSNSRLGVAFKVYQGAAEIARVYNSTTTYAHTIPLKANDTLSVKYVGVGKLYLGNSFMYVLLLSPTTQPFSQKI